MFKLHAGMNITDWFPMSQTKKAQLEHILSERLRTGRIRLGLTQQGLADLTGFSLSAIGNWESCQNAPSPAKLGVLAEKLGVSIDYLLGHDTGPGTRPLRGEQPAVAGSQPKMEIFQVPIVAWAQAGNLVAYTDLDASWHEFTATTCRDENCFAVTIEGDSMEPKYSAGDIAVADAERRAAQRLPGGLQAEERGGLFQAVSPIQRRQNIPAVELQRGLSRNGMPKGRICLDLPRRPSH